MQGLKLNSTVPQRPGYGTKGKSITLSANYLQILPPKDLLLYRYTVEVFPGESGKMPVGRKTRRIIQLLLEQCLPQLGPNIVTDFKSNIVSTDQIPLDQDISR